MGKSGKKLSVKFSAIIDKIRFKGYMLMFTACRTRLINDQISKWMSTVQGKKQVLNLGVGFDTRAFWLECLKNIDQYIEVDVEKVMNLKAKILEEQGAKPLCKRVTISMDFSKESVKDLHKHGVDNSTPTCWVLEGLVMYLTGK